ncbi:hypothetical protein HHK36_005634 [Tetracentron sinense]|uniref:Uncharacterized protein n=1 Tax=Tetracentron sinense TaxID=13715 RepID=A0A834ZLT1_TETSI|nr:hypothetical protein HHK36_005634 [Tetracentron sinense]
MTWASDEWGSPKSENQFSSDTQSEKLNDKFERESKIEEEALLREKKGISPSTEVKIKITKKQLEELLGRVDVKGLSIEQVLAQLMSVSYQYKSQQRPWRPALYSIPELN